MEDQGRSGAFEQATLPHLDAAYNLARWLVGNPSIAADVVQDAYERAWKDFAAFRGGSGRPWLLRIVRDAAYSKLGADPQGSGRSVGADADVAGTDAPDPAPRLEAMLRQRQDPARLDDALNALPVAWRECLILREVEALSYTEMARVIDLPVGAVMSRLARARRALRREAFGEGRQPGSQHRLPAGTIGSAAGAAGRASGRPSRGG